MIDNLGMAEFISNYQNGEYSKGIQKQANNYQAEEVKAQFIALAHLLDDGSFKNEVLQWVKTSEI